MEPQSYLVLLAFVAACFLAASSGAIFRPGNWYERLAKPSWRPPNWVFGPAWAILFAMIAVSGWLAWVHAAPGAALLPLAVYAVQLLLNALWSAIFFGLRRPGLALLEMVALWLAIVANIVVFLPVHSGAALLLVPYLLWVSFAFTLNFAIWRLNQHAPELASR